MTWRAEDFAELGFVDIHYNHVDTGWYEIGDPLLEDQDWRRYQMVLGIAQEENIRRAPYELARRRRTWSPLDTVFDHVSFLEEPRVVAPQILTSNDLGGDPTKWAMIVSGETESTRRILTHLQEVRLREKALGEPQVLVLR